MKNVFLFICLCWIFGSSGIAAPLPVNNPLRNYRFAVPAWAGTIKWNKVVNAADIAGLVNEHLQVDSTVLSNTLTTLSSSGGGVLYFPAGIYYFSFNFPLYDNVIIRGADPVSNGEEKAKVVSPTRFEFPKLALNKSGRPADPTKFRYTPSVIFNPLPVSGATGLVNLDLNRATVLIGAREQPAVSRLLIVGVRSNNAALKDQAVPSVFQQKRQRDWQIWPDVQAGNFMVGYTDQCLIAACTLNDEKTDDLQQADYMTNDGMVFDGSEAVFSFTGHAAMNIAYKGNATDKETVSHAPQLINNTWAVNTGISPILVNGVKPSLSGNKGDTLKQESLVIKDGLLPLRNPYLSLYDGSYPSEAGVFVNHFHDTLPYRLVKPSQVKENDRYPLIVFLHDFWERGSDNKKQLRQFVWQLTTDGNNEKFPCYIVAPQLPESEQKWKCVSLGSETWSLQSTVMLIDSLCAKYKIDQSRIYLVGESLGASGALNLAIHYPERFAAVVPFSMFYVLTKNAAMQLKNTPVWLFYGANDERIAPRVKKEIQMDLISAGVPLKYTEVPEMGHRIWNGITDKYPDLLPWLFNQKKTPSMARQ